jgi:hypothetical protein
MCLGISVQLDVYLVRRQRSTDVQNEQAAYDFAGVVLRLLHTDAECGKLHVDRLVNLHGRELGQNVNLGVITTLKYKGGSFVRESFFVR